jgi:hypothetical protein
MVCCVPDVLAAAAGAVVVAVCRLFRVILSNASLLAR